MSAAVAPLTLTAEQLRQYREEGYTIVRGMIPPAALLPVRQELTRIEEGESSFPIERLQVLDKTQVTNSKGLPIGAGVQLPSHVAPEFKVVADHPNLQAAMSQLLGGPVKRFTDQCGIKTKYIKTAQGGQSYFHQDSYY